MTDDKSLDRFLPSGLTGGTQRCGACLYDLSSLPTSGICPECGSAYDLNSEIVLFGWPKQGHRDARLKPWKMFGSYTIAVGIVVLCWWFSPHRNFDAISGFWPWLLAIAVFGWQRLKDHPPIEVWFTPAGIVSRSFNHNAPSRPQKFRPWNDVGQIKVKVRKNNAVQIRIRRDIPWIVPAQDIANGVFNCTPAQAAELQARMDRWQWPTAYVADRVASVTPV